MERIIKKISIGFWALVFGSLVFTPKSAVAEMPNSGSPYQYIVQLGQMGFAQGGGVFLPPDVLQAMHSGNVPLIGQYVLVNSMFNQCMKDIKKYTPNPRDPFTVARSKFNYGVCRITACQQQGMLLLALPLLSNVPAAGGSSGSGTSANSQFAMALAQSFSQTQGCGGQGPAINPQMLQLLMGSL